MLDFEHFLNSIADTQNWLSEKAVVLLLLIHCFVYLPLSVRVPCWSFFWFALLYVLSSFAIILTRKRELVYLLVLSCYCKCPVALPHGAVGWSSVCVCGIS